MVLRWLGDLGCGLAGICVRPMKAFLAAMFASLWLLDTAATVSSVQEFGLDAEANPLMRWLIAAAGLHGFALTKAGILTFWLSLHQRAHVVIHWGLLALMAPIALMGMVMAWG